MPAGSERSHRGRARRLGLVAAALVSAIGLPTAAQPPGDGWRSLFNGRDLSGWKKVDGLAEYRVEGGAIVGITSSGTPNTFLVTEDEFGDFVLELEFLVDPAINSGVQIRSERREGVNFGRTYGYQVEIDPSERAWTAGIYDEGRRGWLFPLTLNPAAQTAFRQGEWNRLRVEARGRTIRTWLNDVPAAFLVDELTGRGFIALQVHAVRGPEEAGREVRWRDIRIRTGELEPRDDGDFPFVVNTVPNELVERETELGWRLLFDGETTRGWRGAHREEFPERGWVVEDGALTVLESGGGEAAHGGDVVTIDEFAAFELQLEFRFTEGANSGIKYFVTEGYDAGGGSAIGLEYQILDDERHPDARLGRGGNRTLASLYDLIPAEKQARFVEGPGEWNHARLVVRPDRSVEHWLNHMKVLEYVRGSEQFLDLVSKSKYRNWEGFGQWETGHILLQDHGNRVSFRSIKVRDLTAD